MGGCGLVEYVSDLLGEQVDDFDTDMRFICREGCAESFLLTLREPLTRGAQEITDLIEGIPRASTVAQCVLLDAAAHLTWGVACEFDDMEGVQHAGGVLDLAKRWRSCCPWKGIQCRDLDTGAKLFAALGQLVLVHGARPARHQVHSSGPWGDPPLASGPRCR